MSQQKIQQPGDWHDGIGLPALFILRVGQDSLDPEGIVSTLPAIATTLFGVMAGHILRLRRELSERTTWLYLTGTLLVAAALVKNLCKPKRPIPLQDRPSLYQPQ